MAVAGLTRWPIWRRWFGARAERAAAKFLKRRGYRILQRNVVLRPGELDLVALDGDTIVFVEVRSTESAGTERPGASVDHGKQQKLSALSLAWLQRYRALDRTSRFDIVAVSWPASSREPTIEHIIDAFPPTGKYQMFS